MSGSRTRRHRPPARTAAGRRQWGHGTRQASDLPRRGTGRRQDVRDALRGAPPRRARHRLRGRLRGAPRPAAHRGDAARPGAGPAHGARRTADAVFTEMDVDAVLARARPPSPWWTNWPTPTCPAPATPSAGRTSRSCSRPGIDVDIHRQHPAPGVAGRRRRVDHRRTPAARPSRTRWCAGPTRSSWSTCRPRRCAAGWRTATSTSPTRSTRPCPTTSAPATSPPCASWPCCGSPTGSTSTCQQYRSEHRHLARPGRPRERIVVGLTGGPEGRTLIRRAARMAEKGAGGEILAVYIARSDGLTSASPKELAVQRTLVEDLGGTFHHVVGDDIPAALLDFARGVNATQIVLGSSRRKTWQYIFGPGRRRHRRPRVRARPGRPHRHPRRGRQGPRTARRPRRPARPVPDHLGLAGRRGRPGRCSRCCSNACRPASASPTTCCCSWP